MLDDVSWQAILDSDQHLNHFVEVVTADLKHFNDPWKNPVPVTNSSIVTWTATK